MGPQGALIFLWGDLTLCRADITLVGGILCVLWTRNSFHAVPRMEITTSLHADCALIIRP